MTSHRWGKAIREIQPGLQNTTNFVYELGLLQTYLDKTEKIWGQQEQIDSVNNAVGAEGATGGRRGGGRTPDATEPQTKLVELPQSSTDLIRGKLPEVMQHFFVCVICCQLPLDNVFYCHY